MDDMSPSKPYMIRAIWEWVIDNELTPHLMVDALYPGTMVPQQFVRDGQIVLNVAPSAVVGLDLDNAGVSFNARFGGIAHDIYVPVAAVLGIYARENGRGMMFEPEEYPDEADELDSPGAKSLADSSPISLVEESKGDDEIGTDGDDEPTPPKGGRPRPGKPFLKVVR